MTATDACTLASHAALLVEPDRFRAASTMVGYVLALDGEGVLEMRNCRACGSTLSILVGAEPEEVAEVRS